MRSVFRFTTIYLLFISSIFQFVIGKSKSSISECVKIAHNSFTSDQKNKICKNSYGNQIGPAICSSYAKDFVHLKFDDILELCQNAENSSPAECMKKLDSGARSKYGISLCKYSSSLLPLDCFNTFKKLRSMKIKDEDLLGFCNGIVDTSPLNCLQAVFNSSSLPLNKALHLCKLSVGGGSSVPPDSPENFVVSHCINQLLESNKPSKWTLDPLDIVKFCIQANPTHYFSLDEYSYASSAASCLLQSADIPSPGAKSPHTQPYLSIKQRLELCSDASVPDGPVNCSIKAIKLQTESDPMSKLKPNELVSLCQYSFGTGPVLCFKESRGLGNTQDRIALCNGAMNSGPARCYRLSKRAFKSADSLSPLSLCVGSEDEGPAVCAASAPQYLTKEEKINLCLKAPFSEASAPGTCLQAIQSVSKLFQNAPKKALGYFIQNLNEEEKMQRQKLFDMCSFSYSQSPLASAECLKRLPKATDHDTAVHLCTNISTAEAVEHIQFCRGALPKTWNQSEASGLCQHILRHEDIDNVIKCAIESQTLPNFRFNKEQAIELCSRETQEGLAFKCARKMSQIPPSLSSGYLVNPRNTISLCANLSSKDPDPSLCVRKLAEFSRSRFVFDDDAVVGLCCKGQYESILSCLASQQKRMVSAQAVETCASEKSRIKSLRVWQIRSESEGNKIMAGRPFALWFKVFNQWGQPYIDMEEKTLISVSLNANNPQGAILWGIRSNFSQNGIFRLDQLMISQPGHVEFKIKYKDLSENHSGRPVHPLGSLGTVSHATHTLDLFYLDVLEDPVATLVSPCIYIFKDSFCPSEVPESDWVSEFPRIRSYYTNRHYVQNIHCAGDVLSHWLVNAWTGLDGSMWVEYRSGIDSIWTGIGMPRVEMEYEERLEVPRDIVQSINASSSSSKKRDMMKSLRRAYYRKSLQWHPDRWSGLTMYQLPVQGAFELINEAYHGILELIPQANGKGQDKTPPTSQESFY